MYNKPINSHDVIVLVLFYINTKFFVLAVYYSVFSPDEDQLSQAAQVPETVNPDPTRHLIARIHHTPHCRDSRTLTHLAGTF